MLILAMTYSGSLVFLAILLCAILGKRVVSTTWIYGMLRLNLIFFCLPLPKYNSGFQFRLAQALGVQKQWETIDFALENVVGIEESGRLHMSFRTYIIWIWAAWMFGLLIMSLYNARKYRAFKILKRCPRIEKPNYLAIMDRVKKEVGIRRNITLLWDGGVGTALTMGVFRCYVMMPDTGLSDEEIYYILKHELIHAKRRDVGWRYLGFFALLMHWFNPLVYLYVFLMTEYSELSCDEILIRDLDAIKVADYGLLMVEMAQKNGKRQWRHGTYFSLDTKLLKWRVKHMIQTDERKKWRRVKRAASLLMGLTILFGGSLTVCAYEDSRVIRGADQSFMETSSNGQFQWDFVEDEDIQIVVEEFVADDGTRYDLSEMQNSGMERAGCIHAYKSGYLKHHEKFSNGGCETIYYKADLCYKCGEVILKGYSHTETWAECPH